MFATIFLHKNPNSGNLKVEKVTCRDSGFKISFLAKFKQMSIVARDNGVFSRLVFALLVTLSPISASALTVGAPASPGLARVGSEHLLALRSPDGLRSASFAGNAADRASIDWLQYIASYGDLIRAYGPDSLAGERHYERHGLAEGRSLDLFNERQYLANYPDLRAAYGTDLQAAIRHFIVYGYYAGRTDKPLSPTPLTKPDVILILVDELGPDIMGPYARAANVITPNIDALAGAGVVYTSGYGQPGCVPARAQALSGKWPQRRSIGVTAGNTPYPLGSMVTVAERLRPLGYATHAIGKWHLGWSTAQQPAAQGFDDSLVVKGELVTRYHGADPANPLYRNSVPTANVGFITDTFGAEVVRLLRQPRTKPRFIYFAPTAMHYPLTGEASLAAVLKRLDDNIGRIVAAADPNTLFLFAGDNGFGPTPPFVGRKFDILEAGIRVKYQLTWKGHVRPGRTDVPASLVDWSPTIVAAAGGVQTDADGYNLLEPLPATRSVIFDAFYADPGVGVRMNQWKFYQNYRGVKTALYDIRNDQGETHNVAAAPQNTAMVAYLTGLVTQYKAKLAD